MSTGKNREKNLPQNTVDESLDNQVVDISERLPFLAEKIG